MTYPSIFLSNEQIHLLISLSWWALENVYLANGNVVIWNELCISYQSFILIHWNSEFIPNITVSNKEGIFLSPNLYF